MLQDLTKTLATSLYISLLSGCATTDCDPGRGGFVRGIGCSVSGSYTERQQKMQASVSQEQQVYKGLNKQYASVNSQAEQTTTERKALEVEYSQLQSAIDSLNNKLEKSKVNTAELKRNIKAAQNQLNLLKVDEFSPELAIKNQTTALDKRLKDLEKEVDMVRGG